MAMLDRVRQLLPVPVRNVLRPIYNLVVGKHNAELDFWRSRHAIDGGRFRNDHYERILRAMAGEATSEFVAGKVIADFGCGPRGSLAWAAAASFRIGIDVLAPRYADEFTNSILSHGMVYVTSTEKTIPIPSDFVDVMFTLNAIDHVNDFRAMCSEIVRVIKPGGRLVASFNLEEPASSTEPQQLSEELIRQNLLNDFEVQSYRITAPGPEEDLYRPFFEGLLPYTRGKEGFLWVSAIKPR